MDLILEGFYWFFVLVGVGMVINWLATFAEWAIMGAVGKFVEWFGKFEWSE